MLVNNYDEIIRKLCEKAEFPYLNHRISSDKNMPSNDSLSEIINRLKKVLFPGFWGYSEISSNSLQYYIGANLDIINRLLAEQIKRGFCFYCKDDSLECKNCEEKSLNAAISLIEKLSEIKELLKTDIQAAYLGDPAAKSYEEIIFCYPSIIALTHHRIAHELLKLDVPLIPRMINEIAHSLTGIDIHPGAEIGEYCFIDHGTGVVIGETSIIGKNVRIYQGVTLGAKSFPLDESGVIAKGIPRHPIVEDNVVIYANATILGRINIKNGSVIGGNSWITNDVN
jgi:serine O-acetyltransferase